MAISGFEIWADNAATVLANSISPTSGTINVQSGTGSKFPTIVSGSTYFRIVLTSATTPNLVIEVMVVTAKAGDTFTVLRGQEGTTAQSWAVGDLVFNAFSAGGVSNFTRIQQQQYNYYISGTDNGTANAYVITMNVPVTSSSEFQNLMFQATNTNTTASTVQIVGAATYPIIGLSGVALQGGEILAGSIVELVYNGSSYVLQYANGGAMPVGNATASHHAIAFGQQGTLNVLSAVTSTYATNAGNSTTTSQTDFSNLTIATSQVLSAVNFNTYAPTKTGTGASGTWAINITGNAATATNATNAATLTGNWVSMPAGTTTTFYQTAAPAGWTQITTVNDATVRIVSGTGGTTGGSTNFSSTFVSQAVTGSVTISGGTGSIGTTVLTANQLPAHTHGVNDPGHAHGIYDPSHSHSFNAPPALSNGAAGGGGNGNVQNRQGVSINPSTTGISIYAAVTNISIQSTGSNQGHTHSLDLAPPTGSFAGNPINLAVKYINMIICQKN